MANAYTLKSPRGARAPDASQVRELYKIVSELTGAAQVAAFFTDLCTPEELRSLSERWRVARLLNQGIPYRKIQERTGVSTATVTRVARALLQGEGGYQAALQKGSRKK